MFIKYAMCLDIMVPFIASFNSSGGLLKMASGSIVIEPGSEKAKIIEGELEKHPTALFFRSKAIEANKPNSNGDYFSTEELLKAYKTFEGVPFFTNHDNQNVENARGKVIFAEWISDEDAAYTISFVDREAFPHICRSIEEEYITGVSMGFLDMDAEITMSDLSSKKICDVSVGDTVLTPMGNACRVGKVYSDIVGTPMYELDLITYHKSPLLSCDHPLYIIPCEQIKRERKNSLKVAQSNKYLRRKNKISEDSFIGQDTWRNFNYKPEFRETKNCKKGDYVLVPSKYRVIKKDNSDKDFWYLAGAYVGDGYLSKSNKADADEDLASLCYYIGLHEKKELGERIESLLPKFTKSRITKVEFPLKNGLSIGIYDRDICSKLFKDFGKLAHNKRIYKKDFAKEEIVAFISGYIDTDGTIARNYNKKQNGGIRGSGIRGILISSCNQSLLEDVQSLLISINVPSYITWNQRLPNKNSVVKVPTLDFSLFIAYSNMYLFSDSIKVRDALKNKERSSMSAGEVFIFEGDNGQKYMACPIKNIIETQYDKPCYDLKVEDDECYIADGIGVHNCSVEYSICNICGNKAEKTEDYCFSPGTLITMNDGSVKNIEDVTVGDNVIDAFGEETIVTKCFVHDVKGELLSITSKAIDGELVCTKNHPFLAERRGELSFIPSEYLSEKETLFLPIIKTKESEEFFDILGKNNIEATEDNKLKLSKLIGYYIAEGSLTHNDKQEDTGFALSLGSDEKELIEDAKSIIASLFKKEPEIVDRNVYNHKSVDIRIYHPMAVELVKNSCIGKSKDKKITSKVFNLPLKYLQEILAGYIDGDGYSDKYGRMVLTTASRNLAYQLINMLIKIGIPPSIYSYLQNGGPNNRDDISYRIYRISIGSVPTLLFKNTSLKCKKSQVIASQIKGVSKNKKAFEHDGFVKHASYSIDPIQYCGPVYNFETETHSYVANNTAVHNCSHIKERKGRTFSGKAKDVRTGEVKEFKNHPVFEYNYGIKFIELSAVVDPACPSCRIQGLIKNDELLKRVANVQNNIFMYKTAAMFREAGQQEIQQLNQVLQTLEGISIQLIKNRQQVEVEFASDLVNILSELQKFVDELVGAGYGNVQGIPGVANTPAPAGELPGAGLPPAAMPVAQETPLAAPAVGSVSGAPGKPLVQAPNLPISAPAKPKAYDSERMQKIAGLLIKFDERFNNKGEEDMANRRTLDAKNKQKDIATKTLSNSWQEKQYFFEYINKVPSIQDNEHKLSIKKRDDSFVIVAETKDGKSSGEMIWTYENLTNDEKDLVKRSPKEAASYFLNRFAGELKLNKKQGETVMTSNTKEAGAKSVNKTPEVITEKQLEQGDLYHARTEDPKNVITEKQLDEKRADKEEEVITEAQLASKSSKLHPRTEEPVEVITEAQLNGSEGVSPRTETPINEITQKQLDPNRTGTDPEVITEKQLDSVDAPWSRAANRDVKMFKGAGDHMKAVVDVMADAVISTGCTPEEACKVASSLISSTKDRYELGNAILDKANEEDVDYSKRLAYWSKKNIKVASVGSKEIAQSIVSGLRKVASDVTINPDTVIDALDVVSESKDGEVSVSVKVDQKLEAAKKETVRVSKKDELRKALQETLVTKIDKDARDQERKEVVETVKSEEQKTQREAERAVWSKIADSKKNDKNPDTMIETSIDELGCKKDDPSFKSAIKSFARGALAAKNIKLAAVTNVTISGDTVSIAVQTDAGEEGVEIPIGEDISPVEGETVPEGDVTGEGLEANLGAPVGAAPAGAAPAPELSSATGLPAGFASKKSTLTKTAQTPAGGGVPQTPGGVAAPGAPEAGGLPGAAPAEPPIGALTMDEPAEVEDEIPTAGEQQPPWSICPECGSSDVDVTADEAGNGKGVCKNCGAEYEAMVQKEVTFKITKPTRSVGKEEATGAPEVPEVPALPVAAQTKLDKDVLKRIASNKEKHGLVCPACGMKQLKAMAEKDGHTEYACPACGTQVEKDVMINVNNPEQSYLRVKWDLIPKVDGCEGCKASAQKLVSMIKIQGMIKTASNGTTKFPMANCVELVARKWGGNSVATFGPCKGKLLADCLCSQLEKLGMTKVRHLEKLASVYTQKDPMDECIEDQMKNKYSKKEAETICNCLKKKFATKEDANVFLMAFAEDIKSGKEKMLTAQDMDAINDVFVDEAPPVGEVPPVDEDVDIGDDLSKGETVTLEVSKETAQELADAAQAAIPEEVEVEVDLEPEEASAPSVPETPAAPALEKDKAPSVGVEKSCCDDGQKEDKPETKEASDKEKEMATAMKIHKILRVGEEVIKVAATPKKVEDIEGNVEAGVPRGKATMGNESAENIDKPLAKPDVPRKDAYMGKEKEADSLIKKELKLPDVPVDSAFMGVNEKSNQSSMPAINNEIKGTVIAKEDKTVKEAKKMKEVDTVEKDVEAGVPRAKATMGKEGPDNIDVKMDKPDVPRAKATLGKEGPDNIDVKMDAPDVPIDTAFMGHEKEVQKGMPAINDEMLKNVKMNKEVQLERIAAARRMKAVEVTAKLLATSRITEEAYENVIEALSKFEIDKIVAVAESMYPKVKKQADTQASKEAYVGTAIVMESKGVSPSDPINELTKKIASTFTIGNKSFDENLTRYGDK